MNPVRIKVTTVSNHSIRQTQIEGKFAICNFLNEIRVQFSFHREEPVTKQLLSVRCKHTLGMELHTLQIVGFVAHSHYVTVCIACGDIEFRGKIFLGDDPAVIASGLEFCWQVPEEVRGIL